MDFKDNTRKVLELWMEMQKANPTWRVGQALFNAIYQVIPELAEKLRSSNIDPFYKDINIGPALYEVCFHPSDTV